MIVTRLDGGLGNQMFQYAYGLFVAHHNETELRLDKSAYRANPEHGFLLDRFRIEAKEIAPSERHRIPRRYRDDRRFTLLDWLPGRVLRRHKEAPFGFSASHLSVPDNRYLAGYWQSERFFPGMREELLRQFTLKQTPTAASREVAARMRTTHSIAVHLRRGDYLTNPAAAKIYVPLGLDYYLKAIQSWTHGRNRAEVFVFSNDIAWCREHVRLPWPTHFVAHNTGETAHEDLWLMSQAAGCVIANSTFSWWAAWLNNRPDKTIYAPRTWFQPGAFDDQYLIPGSWQQLDSHPVDVHAIHQEPEKAA